MANIATEPVDGLVFGLGGRAWGGGRFNWKGKVDGARFRGVLGRRTVHLSR